MSAFASSQRRREDHSLTVFVRRLNTPVDRESGERKDHTYVVMSSPDVADRLCNSGVTFNGEVFDATTLPDQAAVDLIGTTKRAIVSLSGSEGIAMEDAIAAATVAAGTKPVNVFRMKKSPHVVFLDFEKSDSVVKLVAAGVQVDNTEVFVDYAEERSRFESSRPEQSEQRREPVLDDPETIHSFTASIFGLPIGVTSEEVRKMVHEKTGNHPVRTTVTVNERGYAVVFVEMATPAKARHLCEQQFDGVERPLSVRLARSSRPEIIDQLVGHTSRVYVGGLSGGEESKQVLQAVASKLGEEPTNVKDYGNYMRFTVSSPEVAARLFNEGVNVGDRAVKLRVVRVEEDLAPSATVHLSNIPRNMSENELRQVIEQSTGKKLVRISVMQDPVRGDSKGFAYAEFSNIDDAAALVAKGMLEGGGRRMAARFARDKKTLRLTHVDVSGTTQTREALHKAVEEVLGVAPLSVSAVEGGKAKIVLQTAEQARALHVKGLTINGEAQQLSVDQPVQYTELAGKSRSLFVPGISPGSNPEELTKAVFEATGIRPTLIAQPPEKNFCFIHFRTPEEAESVAFKGFEFEGVRPSLGFARPRPEPEENSSYAIREGKRSARDDPNYLGRRNRDRPPRRDRDAHRLRDQDDNGGERGGYRKD
jgi:hypothetical protein